MVVLQCKKKTAERTENEMNKMLRYFYMLLVLMAFFCGTAMAGEIGELVTPTPMPAIETDSG